MKCQESNKTGECCWYSHLSCSGVQSIFSFSNFLTLNCALAHYLSSVVGQKHMDQTAYMRSQRDEMNDVDESPAVLQHV